MCLTQWLTCVDCCFRTSVISKCVDYCFRTSVISKCVDCCFRTSVISICVDSWSTCVDCCCRTSVISKCVDCCCRHWWSVSPAQQVGRCCKKSSGAALRRWHRLWRMERCCQEVAPLNTGVHIALHTLKQVLTCRHVSVGHVLSTCPCLKFVKCRELTHLKGTLYKDARWPRNRKRANSFICTLHMWICQKICECPFASDLNF